LLAAGANPHYQENNYALGGAPLVIAMDEATSCEQVGTCASYAEIVQALIDAGAAFRPSAEHAFSCSSCAMSRGPDVVNCNLALCKLGYGADDVVRVLLKNGLSIPRESAMLVIQYLRVLEIDGKRTDKPQAEILQLTPGEHVLAVKFGEISDIATVRVQLGAGKQYLLKFAEHSRGAQYRTEEGEGHKSYTLSPDPEPYLRYRTWVPIKLDRELGSTPPYEHQYPLDKRPRPWEPRLYDVSLG
jgi:hypothetical protein